MKCVLTRRPNGVYYVLTKRVPILAPVEGTDQLDVYARPGDIMNVPVCNRIAHHGFGIQTEVLEYQELNLIVRKIGEPQLLDMSEGEWK